MMKPEVFEKIVNDRLEFCRKVLVEKSAQYTRNNDKLHNFRSVARRKGIHMIEALDGMLDKHLQSYYDMITDMKNDKPITKHMIDEKIGDIINYFLLGEAIMHEHNEAVAPEADWMHD